MGSRRIPWLWVGLGITYLLFVWAGVSLFADVTINEFPDTADYGPISVKPIISAEFWGAERPWGVPLFWKLVGRSAERIVIGATAYSLLAWGLLALAVAVSVRSAWLKVVAVLVLLGLGLSEPIAFWNWTLLTESPFISTMLLMISLGLVGVRYGEALIQAPPRSWQLALVLLTAPLVLFWVAQRDTNIVASLAGAGILTLVLVFFWRRIQVKILVAGVILVLGISAGLQSFSAQYGARWQYPFVNILSQRILLDPAQTAYFAERGMPTDQSVMRFAGQWAFAYNHDWSGFENWLDTKARGQYMAYLLTHPQYTVSTAVAAWRPLLDGQWLIYDRLNEPPDWQQVLTQYIWPTGSSLIWLAGLALVVIVGVSVRRRWTPQLFVALGLLLIVIPGVLIVWHGDAMEIDRHSLGNSLQLRLALILIVVFGLDALYTSHEQWSSARNRIEKF